MSDRPTTPPKKRRGIVNADVPSERLTTGLPDVGEGASAATFAEDVMPFQAGERQEPDPDGDDRAG
ncbi:MAG TPA: hypothetical protein VM899_08435 [Rubellimicrobium sp.]|jgi:hypothetical protein|nr:hypothetical protein [Rubellimicrobium sp.]